MKKFSVLLLAMLMLIYAAGCSGENIIEHGEGILNIRVWEGGYGTKWLDNVIDAYKAENPDIKVNKYVSVLRDQVANDLGAGMGSQKYDLYFQESETVLRYAKGYKGTISGLGDNKPLVELNDVYDYINPGETTAIKDKINDYFVDAYNYDGNYYFMNWAITSMGFIYNTSLISESELPNTTEELIALCESLKEEEIAPLVIFGDASYYRELFIDYWAQFEGAEEFFRYYEGKAFDEESGSYMHSPEIFMQVGRKKALEVIEELIGYENGFVLEDSVANSYQVSQKDFFQGKAAMMYNGGWLENEMSELFPDGPKTVSGEKFTLDMMKKPVISAIVEKLDYRDSGEYMSDSLLSDIISAIDEGAPSYEGVSTSDFSIIKAARNSTAVTGLYFLSVVPTTSNNIPLAKEFLKFMYSDKGIEAYYKAAAGSVLPVKDISFMNPSSLNGYSKMLRSNLDILSSASYYSERSDFDFASKGGLSALYCTSQNGYLEKLFASQNPNDRMSAEAIYNYDYNYYKANNGAAWKMMLRNAGIIK